MSTGDPSIFGQPEQYITIGTDTGNWSSAIYTTDSSSEKFDALSKRLTTIEERLAIVIPDEDLMSRFPSLKEAYDHYKLIEKLVNDGKTK